MRVTIVGIFLILCGCRAAEQPSVAFEVRGLTNRATSQGFGTSYSHEATVVAKGNTDTAAKTYEVLFAVKRLGGGDPDIERDNPEYISVYVVNGIGKFSMYAGLRSKPLNESEPMPSWSPERIEVRAVGYRELVPLPSTATSE